MADAPLIAERPLDERRIEAVDPVVAACLRRRSMAERVAMTGESNELVRELIRTRLRWDRPEMDAQAIEAEIARRMLLDTA